MTFKLPPIVLHEAVAALALPQHHFPVPKYHSYNVDKNILLIYYFYHAIYNRIKVVLI